jgi:hypothetical protein
MAVVAGTEKTIMEGLRIALKSEIPNRNPKSRV